MDLSHLEGMSMDEVDAWLQEQHADPAKRARMEQVLLANPEQRAEAEAKLATVGSATPTSCWNGMTPPTCCSRQSDIRTVVARTQRRFRERM